MGQCESSDDEKLPYHYKTIVYKPIEHESIGYVYDTLTKYSQEAKTSITEQPLVNLVNTILWTYNNKTLWTTDNAPLMHILHTLYESINNIGNGTIAMRMESLISLRDTLSTLF